MLSKNHLALNKKKYKNITPQKVLKIFDLKLNKCELLYIKTIKPPDKKVKIIKIKNFKSKNNKSVSNKNKSNGNRLKVVEKKILPTPMKKSLNKKPIKILPNNNNCKGINNKAEDSCIIYKILKLALNCFKKTVTNKRNE
jgi:hypothetical protein